MTTTKRMNKFITTFSKATLGVIIATAAISCNQNASKPTGSGDSTGAKTNSSSVSEKIVYINSDTLSEKYEYFKDIKLKMEAKVKKAQTDLQSKSQAFQREVAEYQQKAASMSASERQATEEKLARKQDELGRLDQNASASIQQDEATEFNNVYKTITEYLKKHATENGYTLVLTYSKSNPTVLYADSKLEITKEVVEALNKEYKATKK
ncbi:OmpH family outer membrane protein [Sphingobacterium spiritivorum]|uniref:Periplasmic chaperone n=2 Tax=Sphingobacterium spiritivorum TaxID=258 RepID=A0A380BRF1_SPHSI|nr:OmpH family outer membrane protein [Sphingobacterium spiritivorum]QQS97006.1 OmpH family outer membrane protein [Sphingobacterium spiritivorum]SUJ05787.1 periplasmic chaperone [Sphingobacterium spiritivorum]